MSESRRGYGDPACAVCNGRVTDRGRCASDADPEHDTGWGVCVDCNGVGETVAGADIIECEACGGNGLLWLGVPDIAPHNSRGVPRCSSECPQYTRRLRKDGQPSESRRWFCALDGADYSGRVCDHAVRRMHAELVRLRGRGASR